jgi:hypothetical protein
LKKGKKDDENGPAADDNMDEMIETFIDTAAPHPK